MWEEHWSGSGAGSFGGMGSWYMCKELGLEWRWVSGAMGPIACIQMKTTIGHMSTSFYLFPRGSLLLVFCLVYPML